MAEILAFVGGLLLAVQVWRWFAALAFLILTPFRTIASLIPGPTGSEGRRRRSIPLRLRVGGAMRIIAEFLILLIPFLIVLPLLLAAIIGALITMLDRRLNQYVNTHIRGNRLWLSRGLDAGLWTYELLGIHIPHSVRRERRRQWRGKLVDSVIAQNQVPYSGTIGVICLIVSFLLGVL